MKPKYLLILTACITALLLVGCGLPTSSVCPPDQLVAPALNAPAMWAVVSSLTPTLSWTSADSSVPYPYDSCHPSGYRVRLSTGPFFYDTNYGYTGPGDTDWAPYAPLQPGTEYAWAVQPESGSSFGPIAGNRYFFTGPICATSALVAPDLMQPANGTMVNELSPSLIWKYPDPCVPEGYRIDLSTDPSFADTSLSGGTGNPSTRWGPGSDLMDCTWYYWRVAPINGTTLGPFSITRSFMVNMGTCLYPMPTLVGPIVTVVPLTLVPLPAFTAPPVENPIWTLIQNANCRYGDSQVFEPLSSYYAGESFPADGRNETSTWVRVQLNANSRCWFSVVTGELNVDMKLLPVIVSPPTPVPTVKPQKYNSCEDYTGIEMCRQDPKGFDNCGWDQKANACKTIKK